MAATERESTWRWFSRVILGMTPKKEPAPSASANPWVQAAETVDVPIKNRGVFLGSGGEAERRPWWWYLIRVLVVAALLIVILVGLSHMFFPASKPAVSKPAATSLFPSTAATGVATRFAGAYLSWDARDPDSRLKTMRVDMAAVTADNKLGWDGKGRQVASGASLVALDVKSATSAIATVAVYVTPFDADGKALTGEWTGLSVPLAVTRGRVVVSAAPAVVGIPTPSAPKQDTDVSSDESVTRATQDYITAFFKAYGSDEDVSAVTAPDAHVQGLGGIVTFKSVRTWTVEEGGDDVRTALASVSWTTTSGATLQQDYTLTLTHVSAGDAGRWQVSAITGRN